MNTPKFAELLAIEHPISLGPGTANEKAVAILRHLTLEELFQPIRIRDLDFAKACMAGLWLRFDELDQSHNLSQSLPSAEGSAWHAMMHRREPDAWNSKYWWRRVGPHPVIAEIEAECQKQGLEFRSPEQFVDLCERARDSNSPLESQAKSVQMIEWLAWMNRCFSGATV